MAFVVIDPGHGGSSVIGGSSPNNAKGPAGLLEKTINLEIGTRTHVALTRMGIEAHLTRYNDQNLGLVQRACFARERIADAFVSIHFNGYDNFVQGTETFYHLNASPDSIALASAVQAAVLKVTQYRNRGVKPGRYGVINPLHHHHDTAACLVEISFMDVPSEEVRLADDKYKEAIANALATSIVGWLIADLRLPLNQATLMLQGERGPEPTEIEDGFAALHAGGEWQQA